MFKKKPTNHTNPHKQIYICDNSCNLWEKKNLLMFFCYSVFKIKHKKKETLRKASLQKNWVDDGDRTHDPQDHNLIL